MAEEKKSGAKAEAKAKEEEAKEVKTFTLKELNEMSRLAYNKRKAEKK